MNNQGLRTNFPRFGVINDKIWAESLSVWSFQNEFKVSASWILISDEDVSPLCRQNQS